MVVLQCMLWVDGLGKALSRGLERPAKRLLSGVKGAGVKVVAFMLRWRRRALGFKVLECWA